MAPARKPKPRRRPSPTFVVGIGGSAGGLDALEQFFTNVAVDTGMAFVVVTHLDPDHKALLPELLQRTTTMVVHGVTDGALLEADTVYVIPPNRGLTLTGNALTLSDLPARRASRKLIDTFFRSLAKARGAAAIGVVLSGMADDGAAGLRAIHAAGGATLVQTPASASFDSMPRAAIAAVPGAERVPPDQLPARIAAHVAALVDAPTARLALDDGPDDAPDDEAGPAPSLDGDIVDHILELLRTRTGHDLRQYKRTAIERRLERRLAVHHLPSLAAYAAYLDANVEEASLLFRELLIGVTHFFRDEAALLVLRDRALPALLAAKPAPRSLRAWVAGCSTGEEAYSLAIILHEVLAQSGLADIAVQIYATDVDPVAISVARAGQYGASITANVTPARLTRHFTEVEHGYRVRKELREMIVFAEHDLVADPPFTRLDVLCCRNVLIYLQPVLQQKLLRQFQHALAVGGLLVLGASETVSSATELFLPVDAKARVFRALDVVRGAGARLDLPAVRIGAIAPGVPRGLSEPTVIEAARRVIVDSVAPPTVVINDRGDLLYASRRTGRYLEPAVGKANLNIFAMAREGLGPDLTLAVRQASARRRRVTRAGISVVAERGRHLVDLVVIPLDEPASLRGLLLVAFEAAAPVAPSPRGARASAGRRPAAAVERELARTKAHLQLVVREMEGSQAQVEAANDELQSANEELQSTNEEMTTAKEELQSLNEELLTLNAELEGKNDELATVNDDLRNLLNSTKIPTLFLDNTLHLKRFTSEATRVANVIAGDVGRLITDITLKLDYADLARDVAEVIDTLVFKEVQVRSADGALYTMRIHPYRTIDNVIDGVVVTFADVTARRLAEEALAARAHDDVIVRLLDRWPGMVCVRDLVRDEDVYLNELAREALRLARTAGDAAARFGSLLHPDDVADEPRWLQRVGALRDGDVITRRIRLRGAGGAYRSYRDRESVLGRSPDGTPTRVLAVIEDSDEAPR